MLSLAKQIVLSATMITVAILWKTAAAQIAMASRMAVKQDFHVTFLAKSASRAISTTIASMEKAVIVRIVWASRPTIVKRVKSVSKILQMAAVALIQMKQHVQAVTTMVFAIRERVAHVMTARLKKDAASAIMTKNARKMRPAHA